MTRRRDVMPDEAKLWRRVAKSTKAYMSLPCLTETGEAPPAVATTIAPTPPAPELPHLVLKRAKVRRALAQPLKAVAVRSALPNALVHTLAEASGHRKVRRGKLDIDARIDLHGMRQIQAQTALAGVIARTRAAGGRCILVVTGKGRPIDPGEDFITPQAGVIRRRLPEWLHGQGIHEHVSGYASAHAKDGGSGAFYVLLKCNKPKL